MITVSNYKNLESIVLENDLIKVNVIPKLGGKIASFIFKENNFEIAAQNNDKEYKIPEFASDFSKFDASGFDDAFPNIDESIHKLENGEIIKYPDHGEIWTGDFFYNIKNNKLYLEYESKELKYEYTKTISIHNSNLKLEYKIENVGENILPCFWAFHGLVRYEEDMKLFYPDTKDNKVINVQKNNELGDVGKIYNINSNDYDFYKVPNKISNTMVKYYFTQEVLAGNCGYIYPTQNIKCKLSYDKDKLPYLGFWITAGGFRGDYNCALEPTNGYYDSIDKTIENNKLLYLKTNEIFEFDFNIELSKMNI